MIAAALVMGSIAGILMLAIMTGVAVALWSVVIN